MNGFSYNAQGGRVVKREDEYHQARLGGNEHLQQQHFHALRRSRSTPEDSSASRHSLPGFATFLQQSPPRHEPSSFAPERLEPSTLSLSSLGRPRTRVDDEYPSQLQRRGHQLHHSSSTSAFASSSRFMDSVESSSTRSSISDASGGSPNLTAFKNIAINGTPSPSQLHSHLNIGGRPGGEPARTRTNYKPTAKVAGSLSLSQQQQQQRPPTRTSRYLREIDRRNILRRIEQGEKQANLAKEYQVSRAAISNLKQRRTNRNRKDLPRDRSDGGFTERRQSEETSRGYQQQQHVQQLTEDGCGLHHRQLQQPSGQHTREQSISDDSNHVASHQYHRQHLARDAYSGESYDSGNEHARSPSSVASPSGLSPYYLEAGTLTSPMEETFDRVTEVKTATMELLISRFLDSRLDPQSMQLTKSRIARLLLETAISEFPRSDLQILMPNAGLPGTPSYFLGAEFTKPTCAVKLVSDRELGSPEVLFKQFQEIEPFCEVGSIAFASNSSRSRQRRAGEDECVVHLPQSIHECNVLLLADLLDAQLSEQVANALQVILRSGVQQRDIYFVSICSHERALRYLLEPFPELRILTAKVLARGNQTTSSKDIGGALHSKLLFQ